MLKIALFTVFVTNRLDMGILFYVSFLLMGDLHTWLFILPPDSGQIQQNLGALKMFKSQILHFLNTRKDAVLDICDGEVAKWLSHLPEEQKIRVRIPPGCKVFRKSIAMLL
jgi:hypothetical protein